MFSKVYLQFNGRNRNDRVSFPVEIHNMINRLFYILNKIRKKFITHEIAKNYKDSSTSYEYLREIYPPIQFEYHDENWDYIKYLTEARFLQMCDKNWHQFLTTDKSNSDKYSLSGTGKIAVHAANSENNWLMFVYRNTCLQNFEFSFDINLNTNFKEVQVSFFMTDLGERYRFMIQDNKDVLFEVVKKGEFYRYVRKKPFTLSLNKIHNIRVRIYNNLMSLIIDNDVIFNIYEKQRLMNGKDIALILWNEFDVGNIECEISNVEMATIRAR